VAGGRKLKLQARAERQAQTRQRIIDAAIGLHTTIGPSRTTISAIAERAGVQRQTVYTHFPDEPSLMEACSAHVRATSPPPDVGSWRKIRDPRLRLRVALAELYPYFRRTAGGWSAILRDAEVDPLVRRMAGVRRLGYLQELRDLLAVGWGARGTQRKRLVACLGLAVDFRTWESLALKQGLDDETAANVMIQAVLCVGGRGADDAAAWAQMARSRPSQ
jgi:AcrR family transcriptional regulator